VNTGLTADIDALKRMNIRKVAVVTPYDEATNNLLTRFLVQSGFDVVLTKGMGIREGKSVAALPDYAAYRFAKTAFMECKQVDGIYVASSRWPTIFNLERLENETGVPVVTSTAAHIWAAFTRLKIRQSITGFGGLLETLQ
jgi:maleate isomerase